jgi:hypothetical protein
MIDRKAYEPFRKTFGNAWQSLLTLLFIPFVIGVYGYALMLTIVDIMNKKRVAAGQGRPTAKGWLHTGSWVRVKPYQAILDTLDAEGKVQGLPFMEEMETYCGKKYRTLRCIHQILVEGVAVRKIENVVLLENLRCDGSAHNNCQRHCTFLWKEEWLSPVTEFLPDPEADIPDNSLADLKLFPQRKQCQGQADVLLGATQVSSVFDLRLYALDFKTGSVSLTDLLRMARTHVTTRMLWKYASFRKKSLAEKPKPPRGQEKKLQAGDWVEVRNRKEILKTLDREGKHYGMRFSQFMWRYCGRRFKVRNRVDRMIVEPTGKMVKLNDTVLLDGAVCDGMAFRGCPRSCFWLWRDDWLKQVDEADAQKTNATNDVAQIGIRKRFAIALLRMRQCMFRYFRNLSPMK